ncbi:hypothetical protein B0H15DRAFT_951278 [Mycena belliarum]|uniref:Uncharacterized protein n=1 Tax=Mycena belliarum TaxID=1033014 RepID=A0AAD6XMG2_9AGAR|nr:hypothetical protein B0H15DRAFT_951278 [Mycena belliae]
MLNSRTRYTRTVGRAFAAAAVGLRIDAVPMPTTIVDLLPLALSSRKALCVRSPPPPHVLPPALALVTPLCSTSAGATHD